VRVLVDTSVWSLALRKKKVRDDLIIAELSALIRETRVAIIGPIRQEILSGISDQAHYNQLRDTLRSFEDTPIETEDYESAAHLFNHCRKKGIQGSHVDFLICAVGMRNDFSIFTLDGDFNHYQKHIKIMLHSQRGQNIR
jgi:predicted nucleic acid-binding protein